MNAIARLRSGTGMTMEENSEENMKTKIFIKFALLATIFFAFSFATFSCSDLIGSNSRNDSDEKNLIEINGNFCVNGAVPSEIAASLSDDADCNIKAESSSSETESSSINTAETQSKNARTALPAIPQSITYKVSATSGSSTVQGEVNQSSKTFTIKLSSGTWTIKAEGFSAPSMEQNTKILEGNTSIDLSANPVKNDISITLSPVSSGNGTIDLTVNFENTTGITSVEMILTKADSSSPITINGSDLTGNQIKLTNANIPAGVYDAVLNFKSSATGTAGTTELKYSAREVINVFSNLTTNTWQGSAVYFTKTDGKTEFKITKALVDTFSRKEFYVKGTDSTLPGTASDNNSGTYFDPFATVQKAVDIINSINDGTSAYTIKVDGTLTQSSTGGNPDSFVNISSTKTLNLTIEGIKSGSNTSRATIDANKNRSQSTIGTGGSGRVFHIGSNTNINVTLKNLTLKGGFFDGSSNSGAGIYLENGNLTLSSVTVTDNTCTNGGGIYVKGGTCQIIDGTISNNNALKGSGIYVAGGSLKISGQTTMSQNKSKSNVSSATTEGTAIYVGKGATAELDGSSGMVTITPADGDNNSIIYLEQGRPGSTSTGGSGGDTRPVPDAVLKLGGNIEIGKSNNTTIKIGGKSNKTIANIMITKKLNSSNKINISYDSVIDNEPIIRGANTTYSPTSSDYGCFTVKDKALGADGNYHKNN